MRSGAESCGGVGVSDLGFRVPEGRAMKPTSLAACLRVLQESYDQGFGLRVPKNRVLYIYIFIYLFIYLCIYIS